MMCQIRPCWGIMMEYTTANQKPPCYYHSGWCHPISFLLYRWPSFNNASCWCKGFSVLSAQMMNAPPVLLHLSANAPARRAPVSRSRGLRRRPIRTVAVAMLPLPESYCGLFNYSRCGIMPFSVFIRAYPGWRSLSEGWVMAESMGGGRTSIDHLWHCSCMCKLKNTTV